MAFAKVGIMMLSDSKINLPMNRAIAEIYRIREYPSLHYFHDGSDELYRGKQRVEYANS